MISTLVFPGLQNSIQWQIQTEIKLHNPLDIKIEVFILKVCDYFKINVEEIRGRSRKRIYMWPRLIIANHLKENTKFTLKKIGIILGDRDHTMVLYYLDHFEELIKYDKPFQLILKEIYES